MRKLLVVIDMQNDFIDGSLGTPQAQAIVPAVRRKIEAYLLAGDMVVFTRDTHDETYMGTQEGRCLPVLHCISGTVGHKIADALDCENCAVLDKPTFGSLALAEYIVHMVAELDEVELCGLCTDICVVSNALILKAALPETRVTVDAYCCAGVSEDSHRAALLTMKMCQVNVTGI